ncbi:MAG: histidine phosphatase family protein [Bradymonadaceae bacterium]|nr:histidine phosphatase family protein [Lujinxingiaceae bacterium]
MNRRLIVMRHAKSSWSDEKLGDHDRPLNERGKKEAPEVARRLVELGWLPERLLSSDSKRTRETWKRMKPIFEEEEEVPKVVWIPDFYHGGMDEVSDALIELDDEIAEVMVLGHNPGWEAIVAFLSGEPVTMTTANAALLEGEGDTWEEALEQGSWELVEVIRPKEL